MGSSRVDPYLQSSLHQAQGMSKIIVSIQIVERQSTIDCIFLQLFIEKVKQRHALITKKSKKLGNACKVNKEYFQFIFIDNPCINLWQS